MSDLNQLRELTSQVHPPSFDSLVTTARRRTRRTAAVVAASVAGGAAILGIVAGAPWNLGEDRTALGPAASPTAPSRSVASTVFDPDEPVLEGGVRVLSQATAHFRSLDRGRYGVRVSDSLLYSVDVPDSS